MNDASTGHRTSVRSHLWEMRRGLAWTWCAALGALAAYVVLKPRPTATDLRWLPETATAWLDRQPDFRTLIMTLGVVSVPGLLLAARRDNVQRRILLSVMVCGMVGCEISQHWIPGRSFSNADLAYTLAGGVMIELAAIVSSWMLKRS